MFGELNQVQINVLIASIIGDGELTKLYKGSRRKNSSYREHYGEKQKEYREWKAQIMNNLFYITPKSQTLRSASNPIFTILLKEFYKDNRNKNIPHSFLKHCTLPYFLAILYMYDGTLSISHRINHLKQKVYITPHIYLYLQNYTPDDLTQLSAHIEKTFNIPLHLASRTDGHGFILRTTSVKEAFAYLETIKEVSKDCPTMYYKTNWDFRLKTEKEKWKEKHPNYDLVVTSSERFRKYTLEETENLIRFKRYGITDQTIADLLGRSYWSVVYKLREMRKMNLL
ncbi:DNA endonuclease [Bacillus sp. B-jedd]|uniref:DNA endonuclease n=1 Tax=Bacillus sp. B-jedd TaxID=1476857 RepID=UPI0005155E8A|nr:DNA endonuclease [Bacillus sp. B-jedd]CEG25899.1 LAGLIDADG DNA endonuclease family protein [Bacillus sp. B-jedd]